MATEAAQASRLQKSFDELKKSMRETKARLEEDLAQRRLDLARRDDEIIRLQSQSSAAQRAASDARDAAAAGEASAKADRAIFETRNNELRNQLKKSEHELGAVKRDLEENTKRLADDARAARMEQAREIERVRQQRDSMAMELSETRKKLTAVSDKTRTTDTEILQVVSCLLILLIDKNKYFIKYLHSLSCDSCKAPSPAMKPLLQSIRSRFAGCKPRLETANEVRPTKMQACRSSERRTGI